MADTTKQIGDAGEEAARNYLINAGYDILETNWRFKRLEVDIIAAKARTIVFVEVKTRKNSVFGEPELFVDMKKQRFLIAAAHQYLTKRDIEMEARFDVIAVTGENGPYNVKHMEDAFFPVAK